MINSIVTVKHIYYLPIIYWLKVVRFLVIMGMASVMMKTTMKPASLMEEIAVDLMLIQIIVMNAYVLNEEKREATTPSG